MNKRKGSGDYHYRHHSDKRRRKQVLEVGMRGFLFTCNSNIKYCIKDAYNILDDYSNKFFGDEKEVPAVENNDTEGIKADKEIEDELEKEVELLKRTKDNHNCEKRFQVVESGANNCLFIKTTMSDPVELVSKIMADVFSSQQQISRYIMRFLPIEVTCKAYIEDIKRACENLFGKHFVCEPTTYCIVYNKRYNNNLLRDEVIESVARLVQDRNILHKVDLNHGAKTIIINVIKAVCCICVVPDYFKFKKYNLIELTKKSDDINSMEVKKEKILTEDEKLSSNENE